MLATLKLTWVVPLRTTFCGACVLYADHRKVTAVLNWVFNRGSQRTFNRVFPCFSTWFSTAVAGYFPAHWGGAAVQHLLQHLLVASFHLGFLKRFSIPGFPLRFCTGFQLDFLLVLNRVFNIGSQQGVSQLQFGAFCYRPLQGDVPGPFYAARPACYWLFLYLRA